jgi:hypothetical protein
MLERPSHAEAERKRRLHREAVARSARRRAAGRAVCRVEYDAACIESLIRGRWLSEGDEIDSKRVAAAMAEQQREVRQWLGDPSFFEWLRGFRSRQRR